MASYSGMGYDDYSSTEHYLKRVLVGNVEAVRHRLYGVLERLDYDFIDDSEFEIEARRDARGWATSYSSANVLDYPRTLLIKLKPLSENSTRASFAYTIKHPSLQRGEKEVLTREAETISTLATIRAKDKICGVCGMESDDDSRFCRKCGTPMTADETAIEVLRMTAEVRSGHISIVTSSIITVVTALLTITALIILLTGIGGIDKGISAPYVLLGLGILLCLMNVVFIGFGWKRINNELKSISQEPKVFLGNNTKTFSDEEISALPPASAIFSITEGTTEILNFPEKTPVFVEREKNTTNDLNR